MRRALARAEEADLRIGVVEAGADAPGSITSVLGPNDLLVRSKLDLHGPPASRRPTPAHAGEMPAVHVSATTGEGLRELEALLAAKVTTALGREEAPVLTRARHRRLVEEARAALLRAIPALEAGPELAAEDVRVAADQIGRLTGRIDVEDLLGEIFSSFCIGK